MKLFEAIAYLAAFLFAGSVVVPDTTVGSPRSILVAAAGLMTAVSAGLAHAQGTATAS